LKEPSRITLLDIYHAVDVTEENRLFRIHEKPNMNCPVGRNIELVLQKELEEAQRVMEKRLEQTTLAQLTERF
jgi:DNA-binding IscR family transcriptional regulator